jgi:hypothetical protein
MVDLWQMVGLSDVLKSVIRGAPLWYHNILLKAVPNKIMLCKHKSNRVFGSRAEFEGSYCMTPFVDIGGVGYRQVRRYCHGAELSAEGVAMVENGDVHR